eukprot:jgi/Chrpa1/28100/Chrysochromulina_OHIO_Genome00004213-RA
MVERYSSTSRILMEYVDNSLVDAESFYDHVAGTYRRAVYIDVFVSNERRTLRIVDNCRGMPPDVLSRVVMRVGESKKRGVSLVNGQFGLGMQSFRAACSTLTVTSRAAGDNAYRICVEREQSDGFRIEVVDEVPALADLSGAAHTGTEVVLSGFDKQWIDGTFGPAAVAREVESHFERLLDRAALSVRVWDADQPGATPRRCQPIDYSRLSPGASVKLVVDLGFVRASGDALANALDPSRVAAEAAARAAREAEEAAKKAEDDERRAEARRQARRMKRQAPAAEQFSVRLVRGLEKRVAGAAAMDEAGAAELRRAVEAVLPPPLPRERSRLVGSTIFVDADHPDFQARWRQTHLGTTKLDDRLCGYLATIVSSHYRERAYQAADRSRVDYAQCYEEMLSTYCRLEEGLRAALPAMLKEMNEQGGFAA